MYWANTLISCFAENKNHYCFCGSQTRPCTLGSKILWKKKHILVPSVLLRIYTTLLETLTIWFKAGVQKSECFFIIVLVLICHMFTICHIVYDERLFVKRALVPQKRFFFARNIWLWANNMVVFNLPIPLFRLCWFWHFKAKWTSILNSKLGFWWYIIIKGYERFAWLMLKLLEFFVN